jgi:hypothetical protein
VDPYSLGQKGGGFSNDPDKSDFIQAAIYLIYFNKPSIKDARHIPAIRDQAKKLHIHSDGFVCF